MYYFGLLMISHSFEVSRLLLSVMGFYFDAISVNYALEFRDYFL